MGGSGCVLNVQAHGGPLTVLREEHCDGSLLEGYIVTVVLYLS